MTRDFIKEYVKDGFRFKESFAFKSDRSNYVFLLCKNGCSMILEEDLYKQIKSKKPSENLKLKLINHGIAELSDTNVPLPEEKNENIFFIIDVTKRCNLDCIYCFRNLDDNRVISDDKLEDICKYILNISNERKLGNINLQVWGGEPLLALPKIEFIHNYFKNTNVHVSINIETNGTLITDKIAKKLFEMDVQVGISIDGTKYHQNLQRKIIGKTDSNDLVVKGIQNLQKYYHGRYSTITVITKNNYKDIPEIINYYINTLHLNNFKFNIVKDNPNASRKRIGLNKKEVVDFATRLTTTMEVFKALNIPVSEGNLRVREENLLLRKNSSLCLSRGCKGGENLISFDMQGNIYPCEMTDYEEVKLGSIYDKDGNLTGNKELIELIKQNKKTNVYFKNKEHKECKKCPWQFYCHGGCSSRVYYSEGRMTYDEEECELNKVLYTWIIEQILKNTK